MKWGDEWSGNVMKEVKWRRWRGKLHVLSTTSNYIYPKAPSHNHTNSLPDLATSLSQLCLHQYVRTRLKDRTPVFSYPDLTSWRYFYMAWQQTWWGYDYMKSFRPWYIRPCLHNVLMNKTILKYKPTCFEREVTSSFGWVLCEVLYLPGRWRVTNYYFHWYGFKLSTESHNPRKY